MPASIGVNLRVTGHCRQGGRKYMEDFFSVAYQQTQDEKDLEYAFFGIFDGHGGMEAATFAKEHLMESIVRQKNFWSDKDEDVLKAIKEGYINTHYAMWREQEKWPKTASGLPSTAGTTASVAFIRRGKIYIGHVGDSGIILGYQEPGNPIWQAKQLTEDHKPENKSEMSRIKQCGGKVITKSGVPRVVWNRPRIGHKGPVRRSTPIDEIPFLAVARSLGDLWSYNSALDEFVVSPDPDTICIPIDSDTFRCLIFGTDGLWNMISATSAVNIVQVAEQHNEKTVLAATDSQDNSVAGAGRSSKVWINPSKCLVERALERWSNTRMRADNTSVITLMLDPPGPPRAEVIKNQRLFENRQRQQQLLQQTQEAVNSIQNGTDDQFGGTPPDYPETGLEILTMYEDPQITNNYTENTNFIDTNDDIVKPESQQYLHPEPCSSGIQQTSIEYSDTVQTKNNEIISETVTNIEKVEQQSIVTKQAEQIKTRRLTEENLDKIHQQVLKDMETEKENQNVESILQVTNSVNNFYETNCSTSSVTTENSTKTIYNQIDTTTTRLKGNTQKTDQKFIEKQPDKDKTQKESKKLINKGGNKTQDENVSSLESREVNNDELKQQKLKEEELNEKIQINEVSSSSPDKFTNDDLKLVPCSRCTRSQDSTITNIQTKITKIQNRKSLRINPNKTLSTSANKQIVTSKILATSSGKQKITKISSRSNSTSPLPRRKTRASVIKTPGINSQNRRTFSAAKREHSDPDIRGVTPADSTRYQANNTVEPPQKLRRSQSLGPRDFTLRSMSQLKTERCLRDRNGTNLGSLGRNSLVNLAAGSSNSFKKISSVGKNFTPVKQAIQTRNRVKRLNK